MNRTPFVLAALLPLAVSAAAGSSLQSRIDVQKLQEDVRVTEIIGADVTVRDGEQSGTVEDVELSADGRIQSVLVDGLADDGMDNAMNGSDEQPQNQRASAGGDAGGSIGEQTEEGFTKVEWNQVNYQAQENALTLTSAQQGASRSQGSRQDGAMSGDSRSSAGATQSQQGDSSSSDASSTFRANDIVGMEVHLSDAKSFGEVEDVLIDQRQGKASALLVDAWEGFDKQTYALPVELNAVNREDNALTYEYAKSDVAALQEYEEQ